MALTLITAPTSEPISLAEAAAHLRIDADEEQALVRLLIQSARETVERVTRRSLMTTVWDYTADGFAYNPVTLASVGFALPRIPVASVASVKYYASTTGTDTTLSSADYYVSLADSQCRIWPAYGVAWPAIQPRPDGVRVRFTAGATTAALVPAALRQAMLLLIGDGYENREAGQQGAAYQTNPTVDRLLWPYRNLEA